MKVFTVCADYMRYGEGYTEPDAVFSTRELAEAFVKAQVPGGEFEISEYEIDAMVGK